MHEYGRPTEEADTDEPAISDGSAIAHENFKKDAAGLDRLCQNLIVAAARLRKAQETSPGGRPKNTFERFFAAKLLLVCEAVHGDAVFAARSQERQWSWRFIVKALILLNVPDVPAERAATSAWEN